MDQLLLPNAFAVLLTGGTIASLAYLLSPKREQASILPNGKKPRTIHTLDHGYPIIGHLVDRIANGERLYDWMLEHSVRYNGEPWQFHVPGQPEVVLLTMPEEIEAITATQFANFPKGESQLEILAGFFGRGLVASDGERWSHQRKASVRFFTAKTLRTLMNQTMQKNVDKMCVVVDRVVNISSQQLDLKQLFLEFTIETFAELGLGVNLDCIGSLNPHPFQKALDVSAPIMVRRFRLPGWYWKMERWLNVGREADMAAQMKIVRDWLSETITSSLANAKAKADANRERDGSDVDGIKSIVELFVEFGSDDVDGLQPEDLLPFLLTFVIGARDTTADTLCWFFYELSKHPEIEEKIRLEMDNTLGTTKIQYLTTEHTKNLTYLEATIKETIRLYPAAPLTMRQAAEDTVICDDIVIRKNQWICMCAYAMARHPRVWGPDAAEFKPERWIDESTGKILQVPASKYFSFSAGPRTCIGMPLAMMELRIATANLLHRYRFDIEPSNDGSYEVAPTLNMKHPLMARVTRSDPEE